MSKTNSSSRFWDSLMLLLQESFFSLTSHPAWWNFWGISSHPLRPQDLSAPSPSELLELWYCEHFQREIFFFCGIFVSKMTFAHFPTERVEIKCQRIQWWPRATSPRAGQPSISHPSKSLPFFLLFVTLFESQVPTGSQNTVPWCPFFDVKKRSHCGAKRRGQLFFPIRPLTVPTLRMCSFHFANRSKHHCQTQGTSMSYCNFSNIFCSCRARSKSDDHTCS